MPDDIMKPITEVPTDYHPQSFRGDGPIADSVRAGLGAVYESVGAVLQAEKAYIRANGGKKLEGAPELYREAMPVLEATASKVGKAIDATDKAIAHAETELKAKLSARPSDAAVSAEIRAHFKKVASPMTELAGLVNGGDELTIRAVLGAPPYLSGLTQDQYDTIRKMAALKFAPEASLNLKRAKDGKQRLERALAYTTDTARKKTASWIPTTGVLAKLKELK